MSICCDYFLLFLQTDKSKIEDSKKYNEQELSRLLKEKDQIDCELLALKNDLDVTKRTFEKLWLELETLARETKIDAEKKVKELETLLADSRNKINDLEAHYSYKTFLWEKKEFTFKSYIEAQSKALQVWIMNMDFHVVVLDLLVCIFSRYSVRSCK